MLFPGNCCHARMLPQGDKCLDISKELMIPILNKDLTFLNVGNLFTFL